MAKDGLFSLSRSLGQSRRRLASIASHRMLVTGRARVAAESLWTSPHLTRYIIFDMVLSGTVPGVPLVAAAIRLQGLHHCPDGAVWYSIWTMAEAP
jgi:hypothetical protein